MDTDQIPYLCHRLLEGNVFVFLHKGKDIASGIADKTFEYLFIGADAQTGIVVVMKRTDGNIVASLFFHRNILGDDLRDIRLGSDQIDVFL
jgi:hypothetical protein